VTISSTIFVGNLPYETTEEELRAILVDADPDVRVRLGTDRVTGKPRGFAFAEFSDAARAADAIRRFDAYEVRGRRLRVNDAEDKPPARGPRPPGGPGGPPRSFGGPRPPFGSNPAPILPGAFDMVPPPDDAPFKRKGGSRRGLRARKRSLRW
jgi:RNA recognition motif-containing protein